MTETMPPPRTYRAPAWLPGAHAQTVYPVWLGRRLAVRYRRERWELDDGDFLDLDWVDAPDDAPLVALFHGLEGNSQSHYAKALMRACARAGWRGVVVHFRGCGGAPNRLPRAYHAGDGAEIGAVLGRMRRAARRAPLHAVGVSLGGNVLLKWLGEEGVAARDSVDRAAAVSVPMDLVAAGRLLDRGFNRVYTARFLRTLLPKIRDKRQRFPELPGTLRTDGIATIIDFDERVTAPLHGYAGALDYWRRASSRPLLKGIRVPTLLVHARNDPFLPGRHLPDEADVSACVDLDFPAQGGHAGFVTGPFPGNLDWLPERILGYFKS
jgi:hypothetical protein